IFLAARSSRSSFLPLRLLQDVNQRGDLLPLNIAQIRLFTFAIEIQQMNPSVPREVDVQITKAATLSLRLLRVSDPGLADTTESPYQIAALRIQQEIVLNSIKQLHLPFAG